MSKARTETLIQSNIRDRYFVSTILRRSSAAVSSPPTYYETLAWEWNPATRERGAMVHFEEPERTTPLAGHDLVCRELLSRCEPCSIEEAE